MTPSYIQTKTFRETSLGSMGINSVINATVYLVESNVATQTQHLYISFITSEWQRTFSKTNDCERNEVMVFPQTFGWVMLMSLRNKK